MKPNCKLKRKKKGRNNFAIFSESSLNIKLSGSVMEVHHGSILALGSGQRLLYRLGSGLGLVLVLV